MANKMNFTEVGNFLVLYCGTHSGFPKCCIDYYINTWLTNSEESEKHKIRLKEINVGYVPCPTCIENKTFVKPINCSCIAGRLGRPEKPDETIEKRRSSTYSPERKKTSTTYSCIIKDSNTGKVKEELTISVHYV